MLLTSSQVQVALSSGIIFLFTLLLFLSGYIVQQRTVDSLHTALRPRAPLPRHKTPRISEQIPMNPTNRLSRPFGKLRDRAKLQAHFSTKDNPFDWNKLAYAQLVRDHSELCNALILFAQLHRLRSPAPKLLLFPQEWVIDNDGDISYPYLETSRRLLRKAARRYRVMLVPIEPDLKDADTSDPSSYSITSIFSLTQFDRILAFPPPGLVLNAEPLDSILAFSDPSTIAAYPPLNLTTSLTSFVLVTPSINSHISMKTLRIKNPKFTDYQLLKSSFPAPSPLLSDDNLDLFPTSTYITSGELRTQPTFNSSEFLETTAFIHLVDPELPGPEYDVPYSNIVKMRPKDEDQGFLWEKMYSTYKDKRYEVCGLDLETWPPESPVEELKKIEDEAETGKEVKMDL